MEPHEQAIREFLQDHPEHIPGVRWLPDEKRGGALELFLDTETLKAFGAWAIRTGRTNDGGTKARRFLSWLDDRKA